MLALSSFAAASSPLPRCRCCRRLCLVIESVQDLVQNAAAYCAVTTAAADVAGCTRHDAKTSRESRLLSSATFDGSIARCVFGQDAFAISILRSDQIMRVRILVLRKFAENALHFPMLEARKKREPKTKFYILLLT